jgi:hypothetical protein
MSKPTYLLPNHQNHHFPCKKSWVNQLNTITSQTAPLATLPYLKKRLAGFKISHTPWFRKPSLRVLIQEQNIPYHSPMIPVT